nr:hypothetical protein [Limosilactobacillus mucosae]
MSVQIHQDSSLKVSLHDQQNGQTWHLKRRGDSYRLSRSLKAGNYQIRVANQTSQKQPIAILKTDHYQMGRYVFGYCWSSTKRCLTDLSG